MTAKIARSIMAAACCVLLACMMIILGCLYDYFTAVQTDQMWAELQLAAAGVETSGMEYLDSLSSSGSRLTWIGSDGTVRYDAQADQQTMENHADRQEVQAAFQTGRGTSSRYSSTLLEKTVYCALRLEDGSVLRISVSRATMAVLVLGMIQPICLVIVVALILAFILASRLARRIVAPLNDLDLDHPMDAQTYDEIAPLLRRISQQRKQIDWQIRQLQRKQEEFAQITASMNEGLVLLDEQGVILSINPAACRVFHADETAVGAELLTVERSREVSEAIDRALQNGRSEIDMHRDGRHYQLDVSRIATTEGAGGVVLLIFDVTEKADAERARREFTANVSHELKTPLTAILGSSELLQAGMVKADDMPRFVGHIHDEAARLLTLIEDIIRLSQLDEGVPLPMETVELSAVAREAVAQLQEKAEQCQVQVSVHAAECRVEGVPRLMHEIAFNLVENAIKYNVPGGKVDVSVSADGVLTVADTGIGIPQDQQSRVFERFYRVDKSHSRQTGGTGLGLSIVKHAAAYLGARIDLTSELDHGTTVTVAFAAEEQ